MSDFRGISGTPWHVEKFTRAEGDDRRHRNRCIYYHKDNAYCSKEVGRCRGAAHCKFYKEPPDKKNDNSLRDNIEMAPSSFRQETKSAKTSPEHIESKQKKASQPLCSFSSSKKTVPSTQENQKIQAIKASDKPDSGSKKQADTKTVTSSRAENPTEIKPIEEAIVKVGTKVQDSKLGLGVVREVRGKMIKVYFERNRVMKWIDSYFCIRQKALLSPSESNNYPRSREENTIETKKSKPHEETSTVKVGAKIMDKNLGIGTVREVNGRMVWVFFESYGISKLFDSSYCQFVDS